MSHCRPSRQGSKGLCSRGKGLCTAPALASLRGVIRRARAALPPPCLQDCALHGGATDPSDGACRAGGGGRSGPSRGQGRRVAGGGAAHAAARQPGGAWRRPLLPQVRALGGPPAAPARVWLRCAGNAGSSSSLAHARTPPTPPPHHSRCSPSDETFETRLFRPYQDAFPPPGHVHPGHLVVNKPDLRPEHWAAAGDVECRCAAVGTACCSKHAGGSRDASRPCRWAQAAGRVTQR